MLEGPLLLVSTAKHQDSRLRAREVMRCVAKGQVDEPIAVAYGVEVVVGCSEIQVAGHSAAWNDLPGFDDLDAMRARFACDRLIGLGPQQQAQNRSEACEEADGCEGQDAEYNSHAAR